MHFETLDVSGGSVVKNLPAVQETWVWSLCQEDPLEEGMATCSSILAWRIPWTEEPGLYSSWGHKRVGCNWATKQEVACLVWMSICVSVGTLMGLLLVLSRVLRVMSSVEKKANVLSWKKPEGFQVKACWRRAPDAQCGACHGGTAQCLLIISILCTARNGQESPWRVGLKLGKRNGPLFPKRDTSAPCRSLSWLRAVSCPVEGLAWRLF